MGRRRNTPSADTAGSPGRMLRTRLDVLPCRQLFRTLAHDYGLAVYAEQTWPEVPDRPAVFEAATDGADRSILLAVWDRGDHREVDLVAGSPTLADALLAAWRCRDETVESVGQVRWPSSVG